jgi:biotin carboxylase
MHNTSNAGDHDLLLSVGAGREQVASILKAKQMGYSVLAVDGDPTAPGLALADEQAVVDLRDEEAIVSLARTRVLAGTLPVPIGRFLTVQGSVNDALGLRGVTRSAAQACTDKRVFNARMRSGGVTVPRQTSYQTAGDLRRADGADWPFPVVLKPAHGSGSRGVVVLSSPGEWETLRRNLVETPYEAGAVVESLVTGTSLGFDGAVQAGRVVVTTIREKEMTPLPSRVELTYRAPGTSNIPASACDTVAQTLQSAVAALGIDGAVFHADAVWATGGDLFLTELSARPAGLAITAALVPTCTGVDFLAEAIRLCTTGGGDFSAAFHHPTILHYWNHPSGIVRACPSAEAVRAIPGVVAAEVGVHVGQLLKTPTCVGELIGNGYVLVSTPDWDTTQSALDSAATLFDVMPV